MLVLGGFGSVLGLCCCGFDFVVALRWFGGLLGCLLWVGGLWLFDLFEGFTVAGWI